MNSIWERISSNDIGVNGVLFKYLSVYQFGDMNNISKTFRQINCDISNLTCSAQSLFFFFFNPSQTVPLFPTLGKLEQSQANSKTIGFFPALLFLLNMIRFLYTPLNCFFPDSCNICGTAPKDGGWGAVGSKKQRGRSPRTGCGAVCWLQPLLWPPRARMLSDREGQLQLACPFSLFLLDLLALDLKLWLILKLLLKNKFHMYYPSSALDTEYKRKFSVRSCVIWINLQSAWLEAWGLRRPFLFLSLWNIILTLWDTAEYQWGQDTSAITPLFRDLWEPINWKSSFTMLWKKDLNFQAWNWRAKVKQAPVRIYFL